MKKETITIIGLIALSAILISCAPSKLTESPTITEREIMTDKDIKQASDGTKYLIEPQKFRSGGPGLGGIGKPGGIASLVDPKFITAEEATYLPDKEFVLGIVWKGEARAYPYRILVWHEIANDVIKGDPILVTYCPLCFTGVAFESVIEGKRELFGVSGKLYNSELVMYDQTTKSYWPQSIGKAVVGERTGLTLKKIPIDVSTWGGWKKAHPNTKVMSQDTGFLRRYGDNPYGQEGNFADIDFRIGVSRPDERLPTQTIVYGVELKKTKAYPETKIKQEQVINDKIGEETIVVLWTTTGPKVYKRTINGKELTFTKQGENFVDQNGKTWNEKGESGEEQLERIVHEPIFWFAWAAFHPDTELY